MMKGARRIFAVIVAVLLPLTLGAAELDMREYLLGHVGDSYGWHIATVRGEAVSVHLPVIVRSSVSGWHVFSSGHIEEGGSWEGFRLATGDEPHSGKLVEETPEGLLRPFDISITRNVLGLMVNSSLVLLIILFGARWYRRHNAMEEAPRGFAGIVEMMVTMVEDDIIKPCVGAEYKKYSPYLLTAFFFIFISNLMGIVPFFPGGANVTGNIAITLCLALFTFLAVNIFGSRHYYKDIFWPDVPVFLKAFPLMPIIETVGVFTKPFSLMVRLFANILAGHMMILGVLSVIFITATMGAFLNGSLTVIAVLFGVFMDILECLVAFLQAYVFTMLSSVFIGLSRQEPESVHDDNKL